MVRLLVISDTHGYLEAARRAVRKGPWDHVIHLGDSALDAVSLAAELGIDIVALRGNNEYPGADEPLDELVFEAGGARFYAVHGHELDLNHWDDKLADNLSELARRAAAAGAKAALFGHTHVPMVSEMQGVLLVNPGGISLGDRRKTCAVVTVDEAGRVSATIEEA